MTILFVILTFLLLTPAASAKEIKPLYQMPEKTTTSTTTDKAVESEMFLVGSDSGLYRITKNNNPMPLWTEGRVDQITQIVQPDQDEAKSKTFMLRTSKGLFYTEDLKTFKEMNSGLPFLKIKKYDGKETTYEMQIQELKDFAVNPSNCQEMVTATKDCVYYSKDGGNKWVSVSSASKNTAGMKAVAVATLNDETVIFMSHPIFGFSYVYPNRAKLAWVDVSAGFEIMQSLSYPDEISDIMPVIRKMEDGTETTEIFISQTYIPRLYRFDWTKKRAEMIYKGTDPVNATDGLTMIGDVLFYTKLEGFDGLNLKTMESPGVPAKFENWKKAFDVVPGMVNTAYIPKKDSGFDQAVTLNELWMLYPGTVNTPYAATADGKKSIYASAYQCRTQEGINKYIKLVKDRNMNSIVIDMKDDYGMLRFDAKDPFLLEKDAVSGYAVDLDKFVEAFKKENIYLVARIVAFKDKAFSKYDGGKYAVWDASTNGRWLGVRSWGNAEKGTKTQYYDEHWCDPYSEKVWEYDVAVAKELVARGFDEIQFDYIRFPTDGLNLGNARYRWKTEGMDKESALISFLKYARENIDAPIGIDIYGANGWYRSGTRTGQDSEMLAEYVDVIGPMFYPSHFEQSFLNYAPWADRTYRIYYYGTFRNTVLCRNRAIIRPWVQCFYLNVSYDRNYYDTYDAKGRNDYIAKQFFGVRDSVNRGYMCWNNSGDYSKTPKDVTDTEAFSGTAPEASFKGRIPAIGTFVRPVNKKNTVSVADDKNAGYEKPAYMQKTYNPFLRLAGFN